MRLSQRKSCDLGESDVLASERQSLVSKAKVLYESMRLKLEREFGGQFVAIEPESQEFFVGQSFDSAVTAARTAHPNRVTHTIRIGHQAAFHIGLIGTALLIDRIITVDYKAKSVSVE